MNAGPTARWPWLVCAALLIGSAASAARANYLHWLPCRGSMLAETPLAGLGSNPELSRACLQRMDAGPAFFFPPVPSVANPEALSWSAAAIGLSGFAWLVLMVGLNRSAGSRLLNSLPAGAPLLMAAWTLHPLSEPDASRGWVQFLWVSGELGTAAVLIAILSRHVEIQQRHGLGLIVVAWGATAFGGCHVISDYIVMAGFSHANWDYPPGTGYFTAAALAVAGIGSSLATFEIELRAVAHRIRHRVRPPGELRSTTVDPPQKCSLGV